MLEDRGIDVEIIEYLKSPLTKPQLLEIMDMLEDEPAALVRKDKNFAALDLDADDYVTPAAVADVIVAHPELMQRPIAIKDGKAVIGRPSERVLELL